MFNKRWCRDFEANTERTVSAAIQMAIEGGSAADSSSKENPTLQDRWSELSAIAKDLIMRSYSNECTFSMVKQGSLNLSEGLDVSARLRQYPGDQSEGRIRNPLAVQSKGRPKTGGKRTKSQIEKRLSKSKQKRRKK